MDMRHLLGGALAAALLAGTASTASAQMFEQMPRSGGAVTAALSTSSSSSSGGGLFGGTFGSGRPHLSSGDVDSITKTFDKVMGVAGGGEAAVEAINAAAGAADGKAMRTVGDLAIKASSKLGPSKARVIVVVVESAKGDRSRGRIEGVFQVKGEPIMRIESGPITGALGFASASPSPAPAQIPAREPTPAAKPKPQRAKPAESAKPQPQKPAESKPAAKAPASALGDSDPVAAPTPAPKPAAPAGFAPAAPASSAPAAPATTFKPAG